MRHRMLGGVIAITAATGLASVAQANTIGLQFNGVTFSGGAKISLAGHFTEKSVALSSLEYTVTSVSGDAANYFSAGQNVTVFCTDVFDNAATNTVAFGSVSDVPHPDNPMGSDAAGLMSVLYALYHTSTAGNAANTKAFQLAVWEIAHEDIDFTAATFGDSDLDILSGDFSALSNAYTGTANTWLEAAWNAWKGGTAGYGIAAGYADNFQDVILVIPLPAPVWMGLAGLVGVIVLRRRVL